MSMTILASRCAACGICAEVCPMSAVRRPDPEAGRLTFEVDPARCTECVGHFAWPRCASCCRLGAIRIDPAHFESRATLLRKWRKLTGGADYAQELPTGLEPVGDSGNCDA